MRNDGSRNNSHEATIVIPRRGNGGRNEWGWGKLDSGDSLKAEPTGLTDKPGMRLKEESSFLGVVLVKDGLTTDGGQG